MVSAAPDGDVWVTRSTSLFPQSIVPSILVKFWVQDKAGKVWWTPCNTGKYAGPQYAIQNVICHYIEMISDRVTSSEVRVSCQYNMRNLGLHARRIVRILVLFDSF
jgi:hypothetical protein